MDSITSIEISVISFAIAILLAIFSLYYTKQIIFLSVFMSAFAYFYLILSKIYNGNGDSYGK